MAKKRTILVVDDSTVLLDQLVGAFADAGYEVAHAIDGEEVFRKITAFDPDALLLDVYMPKINGADVCRLLKAHPHWKKIFLVLMSARMSDKEIETYKRMGADQFLKKPFEAADAVKLVTEALAKQGGGEEPPPDAPATGE
ncbi:MAG TPA: response regulator [Myxococcales bacterium]|jgi:twitching motility two-component system response regulator PilG/twitching motility two-component system response regulator PilH